jgi:hypothetical protein
MIPLPTSECPQLNMKETSCPLFVLICTDPKIMKEHITTLLSSRVMRLDSLTQNLSDHILTPVRYRSENAGREACFVGSSIRPLQRPNVQTIGSSMKCTAIQARI